MRAVRVCCLTVAVFAFGTVPALADDTSELESILSENVVTTASTTAQRESSAPATSTTITGDDLRTFGIRTVAEAMNFLGMGVTSSDTLRAPDVGARGVLLTGDEGRHFLLLIDGHAVNDPLYGAARFDQGAGVPLDIVDHIEVIVGPGSVLYGSNAMMGVINVITKTGSQYRGLHASADFEPGRSYRAGAGAGATFELLGKPADLTVGVDYYSRFGPDLEFGRQQFPRISLGATNLDIAFRRGGPHDNVWGGTLRDAYFTQAPSAVVSLRVGDFQASILANAYRRGVPYSNGTTSVSFDDGDSYELDRSLRADIRHDATLSTVFQLRSRVYADMFGYRRLVNSPGGLLCAQQTIETCRFTDIGLSRWAGIEERASFDWLTDGRLVTLLGIDLRTQWVGAKEDAVDAERGRAFAPTTGRLRDTGFGLSPYVQQTYSPFSFLDLNAGARLDVSSRFDPVLSPRGAVAVRPARGSTVKAIYSEAFRAPTWSETDIANFHVAPSQGLRPETVRSLEGSLEQRFGTQRLLFTVFRTYWNDLVTPRALGQSELIQLQNAGVLPFLVPGAITQYVNVARIDNYGYSGGWNGTLGHGRFLYGFDVTAAYTRRVVGGIPEPLPIAPRFFGNARIAYLFGGFFPTPALSTWYFGERITDRVLDTGSTAPPLAELKLTLTGKIPGVRGLQYQASASYLTTGRSPYAAGPNDVRSNVQQSALPLPGSAPIDTFHAFVGLRYDFAGSEGSDAGDAS